MNLSLLQNTYFVATLTFALGVIGTVVANRILNKQAVFSYFVNHLRVGQAGEDNQFGRVEIKWNDASVPNLFLSSVELINTSVRDFEDIEIRAFSNDTRLLTERTEIVGTTRHIEPTSEYLAKLKPDESGNLNAAQWDLLARHRDYIVPVFNRNQTIRLVFLNSAVSDNSPTIWLDVLQKGVKVKFRAPRVQFLGVDQPQAALVGSVVGLLITLVLLLFVPSVWVVALCAFVVGLIAQLPGVWVIKSWRKLRGAFVD